MPYTLDSSRERWPAAQAHTLQSISLRPGSAASKKRHEPIAQAAINTISMSPVERPSDLAHKFQIRSGRLFEQEYFKRADKMLELAQFPEPDGHVMSPTNIWTEIELEFVTPGSPGRIDVVDSKF
ncbi:hypothetical protein E8E13_001886 [Curvularia kusanoi]|uniref:Uncharacterized protein n=1 Tax=Curvularia kusanoi TaxID=90978 RepID=A0A9P4T6N0_CURKU|nr:hypothetical protein E8E13_001886 [Curvularia kusanoi]